ncbi:MAG: hypothetical protein BZY81_07380 [SAR202 cluster bacterium Io17-Chloro-G4]|nr:MAG: hypothetical protein BZY81_07380 [SAR202 cluster bacterium Io17-Chloro-G4]
MLYTEKTLISLVAIIAGLLGMLAVFVALSPAPTASAWNLTSDQVANQWVLSPGPDYDPIPSVTLAVTGSGEVTANFGVAGDATTITALALAAMTSQVSSALTISVQDSDTLDDTQTIRVILLFDPSDAEPSEAAITTAATGSEAVDTLAVFTWTKGSPFSSSTFQLTSPSTGSWSVDGTINPLGSALSGDFTLNLIPSPIAAFAAGGAGQDGWDVLVEVTDSTSTDTDSSSLRDQAMGAFAQISVNPATVSFGTLTANTSNNPVTTPGSGTFDATSVSNQTHALTIQASSSWSDGFTTLTLDPDGGPGVDAISLQADDDATVADAQFVTATAADLTGHSTDGRDTTEAGTVTPIGLFLDLGTIGAGSDFEGTFTVIVDGG